VPVWIDDWVYECCGQTWRLGEAIDLDLTFAGDVRAVTDPDRIDVLDDGQVVIVGAAVGPVTNNEAHTEGTLIVCGAVKFAILGKVPGSRVMCSGRLSEIRHGWPTGRTSGELTGVRWHPAIVRSTGDGGGVIEGYDPGEELASTDDWWERHGDDDLHSWALELTVDVADAATPGSQEQAGMDGWPAIFYRDRG
jgi:hypothetical protein